MSQTTLFLAKNLDTFAVADGRFWPSVLWATTPGESKPRPYYKVTPLVLAHFLVGGRAP